jgi:type III secretion protein J
MTKTLTVLLFLMTLSACRGEHEIIGNLSETEANEVLVVLDSQKISAVKLATVAKTGNKAPTYSIQVSATKAPEALRILVDNHLPRPKSAGLGEVYPSDSSSLIPSQSEEKAKFLRAMQGEVENMLKVLPGIVEARIVVVVPDQSVVRDLSSAPPKATASVAIVYNPVDAKGTPPVKVEGIKSLVASAVEDLTPDQVTVLMSENLPSTLMGLPKLLKKPVKTSEETTLVPMFRDDVLMWLFGVLALAGVLLGIFGIIRNRSLRDQLTKALNAHTGS